MSLNQRERWAIGGILLGAGTGMFFTAIAALYAPLLTLGAVGVTIIVMSVLLMPSYREVFHE